MGQLDLYLSNNHDKCRKLYKNRLELIVLIYIVSLVMLKILHTYK